MALREGRLLGTTPPVVRAALKAELEARVVRAVEHPEIFCAEVSLSASNVADVEKASASGTLRDLFHLLREVRSAEKGGTPFCAEVYTDTEPIMKAARRRGHSTGSNMSLNTGFNFTVVMTEISALIECVAISPTSW